MDSIELNEKQKLGLEMALDRYKKGEKYTIISGYAGTGKSTLVKFIIAALSDHGINPDKDVVFATPTGKAAVVLQQKGNKNAGTLHKLLYKWIPKNTGGYIRIPKTSLEYKIVVVDECSMVSKEMVKQLMEHDVYVIFMGDPGQLPPINPQDDNLILNNPHVFLDEIMRQALDSEIIQLSMAIREGKPINKEDYSKDVMVINKSELSTGMLLWADQIICATNATRVSLNNQMRELLGRTSSQPEEGDKVISLHNEWDITDDMENPLINGTIGYLKNIFQRQSRIPYFWGGGHIDVTYANLVTDIDTEFGTLDMDTKMILTGEKCITDYRKVAAITRSRGKYGLKIPLEFTYGYAITCHKAQGSQWDKILIFEEAFPFASEEHKKWLYTAVTRGAKKVVLVKKD